MKKCTKCKIEKTSIEFYNSKTTEDKLTYSCKTCMTTYRQQNKEKSKLYMRSLREFDNEKVKLTRNKSYRNTSPLEKILRQSKHRAKAKYIEFDIELKDLTLPTKCPYLKVPFIIGTKDNYEYTHSIDRIDNNKGYIKGNVEIITKKANSMKNNASAEELLIFAIEIIKRNIDKDIVRAILKNIEVKDKEL